MRTPGPRSGTPFMRSESDEHCCVVGWLAFDTKPGTRSSDLLKTVRYGRTEPIAADRPPGVLSCRAERPVMSRAPFLALTLVLFAPAGALAHGGGLNAEGCHHDRKAGEYHCHRDPEPSYPEEIDDWEPDAGLEPVAPTRSSAARAEFRRRFACPSTAKTTGPCPGYEVDHKIPLACGGPDTPDNMQWLTTEANRRKGDLGCSSRRQD
ncbi:MAG TPA: YHYH domain-containing protein [Myxococcota bacterium]|nr:YHYH domain-containing protein [Myxococcota bacterium]